MPEKLPSWLSALLPNPRPATLIAHDADGFIALSTDGVMTALGDDIESTYDAVSASGADVVFDDSVREHLHSAEKWLPGSSVGIPTDDGMTRLLMSYTDADRLSKLQSDYAYFLELDAEWRADSDDFLKSWTWIDHHPAFWIRDFRTLPTDEDWDDHLFWSWQTSGHCQQIDLLPIRDDDEDVVITLETGQHVPATERFVVIEGERRWVTLKNTYWEHYHDYRLDIYAATYEEAIIRLAQTVDRFFNTDGTEKPDVAHDVPGWVTELEQRVAELPPREPTPEVDLYAEQIAKLG